MNLHDFNAKDKISLYRYAKTAGSRYIVLGLAFCTWTVSTILFAMVVACSARHKAYGSCFDRNGPVSSEHNLLSNPLERLVSTSKRECCNLKEQNKRKGLYKRRTEVKSEELREFEAVEKEKEFEGAASASKLPVLSLKNHIRLVDKSGSL
ncbi:unnamed protein product [Citrullus colocynthis]|uniref:Uncharacterized protein n=1 Tax=Citrullus colocynthis TaxID=252529 RepID=A0ABP0Y9X2_9ROSI